MPESGDTRGMLCGGEVGPHGARWMPNDLMHGCMQPATPAGRVPYTDLSRYKLNM
jgi:hypothetical protein